MKKRVLSLILTIIMLFSITTVSAAQEQGKYVTQAEQLKVLGVFQGSGNGFELTRQPTRLEGLVMLIRLLGKESEAKALSTEPCPFTDIPTWGNGYATYAYNNGLSKGIGNNKFGTSDKMNALSYMTFMLRALGYDDSKGDFSYSNAINFAKEKGVITATDATELTSNVFLRDHIAKISMMTLYANTKGATTTLLDKLVADGAILKEVADQLKTSDTANLEVHYIDVGQADSILIKHGTRAMLIDGGNNEDGTLVVNYLKQQGITALDYVILTHPDEDHSGGLDFVISTFPVAKVIMSNAISTTKTFEDVLDAIEVKGLTITLAKVGNNYALGDASFSILAPNKSNYSDINNYSVVIKLTYGTNSFLFTGDAEAISESEMLANSGSLLKCDVLKVGHHGSNSSTNKSFLDAVNPKHAIISVGKDNTYGHPDQDILSQLFSKGVNVFRTDEQGTIIATCDGQNISFNTAAIKNEPTVTVTDVTTATNVIISKLEKSVELVTIQNKSSKDIDLTGWTITSVTGNQVYTFASYILKANGIVTIASGGSAGNLVWTTANIWNNSSSDPAELRDSKGTLVFRFED